MKQLFFLSLLIFTSLGFSQQTGSIVGQLSDKDFNNEPLAFANVVIKGTSKGTTSDFDGLYELANIEVGTYTVVYSFVGYETVEIENVTVEANKVTTVNVPMGASAAALDEVVIKTTTRRESEVALLIEQKNAVEMKQSIGAQELARKGVSDAEGAVAKVSGVTKSEGSKNVFVRGLGDRYNSTSLNGLPLPSEDPEYKNIALDFFSSDIIESIGINKTFNSSIYGDVGGANIDIISKELTGSDILNLSFGVEYNSYAIGANFLSPDGANRLGTGIENESPISDLTQYDFEDGLTPVDRHMRSNLNGALSIGKRWNVGENGNRFSAFLTVSGDTDYQYREGQIARYNSEGNQGTNQTSLESEYSTSQLGLLNLQYRFGDGNRIAMNNGIIRKVSQRVGEYLGENSRVSDQIELEDFIRRQQVNKNNLYVNQLLTTFKLSDHLGLKLDGSYNFIRGSEPDRRTNSFIRRLEDNEDFYRVTTGSAGLNHRFYSELEEDDIAVSGALEYKFDDGEGEEPKNDAITIGGNYRNTQRTFQFRQFNFQFNTQDPVDLNNPEALFNQQNLDAGVFEMLTDRGRAGNENALDPFFYEGDRQIMAGFAQLVYDITPNFTITAGGRFEDVSQEVPYDTSLLSSVNDPTQPNALIEETYILPNASLKYNFTENSILRLAGSMSYILPQYKEVAPFLYEDVNSSSFGNPFLKPSDVLNADIKYDYFFSSGELISISGFYKSIQNPINRLQVNSAGNDFSYVNVGDATVAGVELEFRKDIFKTEVSDNRSSELQLGINFSYLHSSQELIDVDTDELTVRFTNEEDELEGASPILTNIDLTYNVEAGDIKFTTSLVGNYFSERIFSLGTAGNENFVEQSRTILDFVNTLAFNEHLSLGLKLKNLLNPDFEVTQEVLGEDQPIFTYKKGINASIGLSYSF